MNAWLVLGALLLAVVAGVGVLRPFLRPDGWATEPPSDPLHDERNSLLRALRDLDEDRAAGRLPEQEYRALRTETESRAVGVLEALERRDGHGELAADLRELRPRTTVPGAPGRRILAAVATLAAVAVVVAPLLGSALRGREPGAPVTGDIGGEPMAFFEQRVRDHPEDLAARLDLAEAYLARNDIDAAARQYGAALRIDPNNLEARVQVAGLLYRLGQFRAARGHVRAALDIDPRYPQALYLLGVILEDGLGQPGKAEEAFRDYLDAAPYGSYRDEVRDRLRED
jgi:tetratricopeptide (TPR) repeat protein